MNYIYKPELEVLLKYNDCVKDIFIVVYNGLEWIKKCLASVKENTSNCNIWVWDNGSAPETKNWLESQIGIKLIRSEENLGFIIPNNKMASMSNGEYLIFLNSDCEVKKYWSELMISHIQEKVADQVGYTGGVLNKEMKGVAAAFGFDCDYISGSCFAISRELYNNVGLFDSLNLNFAYGEDSDFSLRLKEKGYKIYALKNNLCVHYGNKTINEVIKEKDCKDTFISNHDYLKKRHIEFLNSKK